MEFLSRRFSTRTLFLLVFGIGCVVTLASGPSSAARVMGWVGLGVYLALKHQKSLFWIHVSIPVLLGAFAFVMTDFSQAGAHVNLFGENVATDSLTPLFLHYLADAGLFISLLTYPFSFLGVE